MTTSLIELFWLHPTISTDTRNIVPDSLFFALRGASFDGNDYAVKALEQGAAYSVVDRAEVVEANPQYAERLILVEEVLGALQALAREHRRRLGIEILAISGSNGKTTTKELLVKVLQQRYNLYATKGNFNNHIGVPLTLLSMDRSSEFGIVEMGASSCGEIELLCSIAEPNYGVLTNVGRAHLEGFGGEEGVRRGKGELFDYLAASGGVAFVASENETVASMAGERSALKAVEYGYSLADGVRHNLEGEYNRYNIAAAVAVGRYFDVTDSAIAEAIESYRPTNNRSQRNESEHNTLIIDCYNANPSSMEAAIRNFANERFSAHPAKVMILGDMFELGEWSTAEHQRVAELATRSDAEQVILVGREFEKANIADPKIRHFATRKELEEELRREPIKSRSILIKGSHSVGLENIITLL